MKKLGEPPPTPHPHPTPPGRRECVTREARSTSEVIPLLVYWLLAEVFFFSFSPLLCPAFFHLTSWVERPSRPPPPSTQNQLDLVAMLLDHGAAPDMPLDSVGTTPLHWAIARRDHKLARLLLRAPCDVTVPDRYGVLPVDAALGRARRREDTERKEG